MLIENKLVPLAWDEKLTAVKAEHEYIKDFVCLLYKIMKLLLIFFLRNKSLMALFFVSAKIPTIATIDRRD